MADAHTSPVMKADPERLGLAHHGYLFMPLGVGSVEV
jgi:hypothetical protein